MAMMMTMTMMKRVYAWGCKLIMKAKFAHSQCLGHCLSWPWPYFWWLSWGMIMMTTIMMIRFVLPLGLVPHCQSCRGVGVFLSGGAGAPPWDLSAGDHDDDDSDDDGDGDGDYGDNRDNQDRQHMWCDIGKITWFIEGKLYESDEENSIIETTMIDNSTVSLINMLNRSLYWRWKTSDIGDRFGKHLLKDPPQRFQQ